MDLLTALDSKNMKPTERRSEIVQAIESGNIHIDEIIKVAENIDHKKLATVLEAMEEVTRNKPNIATIEWLLFAQNYINSPSGSLKREASRIVGNIAAFFEDDLDFSIRSLLNNTTNEGTVIRWGSAYALSRIIVLPKFANSELFDKITAVCENETENGVKNQYIKALKKALKLRK